MKLKEARKATNLTQAQLAGYLGVSQTVVSMWESGTDAPSDERRRIMDHVLRGQVSWNDEFEPYDHVEQYAIVRFGVYLQKQIGTEAAAKLISRSSKFDMRQMLKGSGFLNKDHIPASAIPPPMLPLEVQLGIREQQRKKEKEKK